MTKEPRFYGWTLLVVLWLIVFADSFPYAGASVSNVYMADDLHFNRSTLGLIFAIFAWMSGMLGPVVAVCVDKLGVRFTLVLGSTIAALGAVLMATFVHTEVQAIAVFGVMMGLGFSVAGPLAAQAGIVRWFVKGKARAISLLMTSSSIGGIVAPILLNRMSAGGHAGWRASWWLVCGLSGCAALMTLFWVKERPSDLGQTPDGGLAGSESISPGRQRTPQVYKTREEWSYSEVLRSPTFWLLLIPGTAFSVTLPLLGAHEVAHLRDLGHSPAAAALSISILSFAMLLGMLGVAAFGDRIEPRWIWAASMLVLSLGVLWAFRATGPVGLYRYAVVVGLGFGGAVPAGMTLMANYYGNRPFASIMGLLAVLATTAGAIAAYGAGLVYDRFGSYAGAYYAVSLLCFAGFAALLLTRPPVRKATPPLAIVDRDSHVHSYF